MKKRILNDVYSLSLLINSLRLTQQKTNENVKIILFSDFKFIFILS